MERPKRTHEKVSYKTDFPPLPKRRCVKSSETKVSGHDNQLLSRTEDSIFRCLQVPPPTNTPTSTQLRVTSSPSSSSSSSSSSPTLTPISLPTCPVSSISDESEVAIEILSPSLEIHPASASTIGSPLYSIIQSD